MRKGIIILFSEDERKMHTYQLANLFNQKDIKLCFVNNGSKDDTLGALNSIKKKKQLDSVAIIDIKKNKGTNLAVKASARYLLSSEDLKCIMYFKSNMLSYFEDLKNQFDVIKNMDNSTNADLLSASKDDKKIFCYKKFLCL